MGPTGPGGGPGRKEGGRRAKRQPRAGRGGRGRPIPSVGTHGRVVHFYKGNPAAITLEPKMTGMILPFIFSSLLKIFCNALISRTEVVSLEKIP